MSEKDQYAVTSNFKAWASLIVKNNFIYNYKGSVRENTIPDSAKNHLNGNYPFRKK
jgi:DNA-directed RNA polymerase specialized sigma24 family protein